MGKVGLAAVAALLTYACCDLLTGWLFIRPLSPAYVPDPIVHHIAVADTYSRITTSEFDYVQRSNNLGLRGRDIDLAKPAGTYRILMLGDSFTQGKGVGDQETFSHLLEARLNGESATETTFEVLNAGTDSYTPVLSYLLLVHRMGRLDLDLVMLNFDMSDLVQEQAYRSVASFGTDGGVVAIPSHPVESGVDEDARERAFRPWIDRHLYLTRWLLQLWEEPVEDREVTVDTVVRRRNQRLLLHTLRWDRQDREAEWRDVFDSIRSIKRYCDDHQIDFVLTTYPWGHQVNDREWVEGRQWVNPNGSPISDRSVERLERFARSEGIAFLDLFPAFRAYRGEELLYYKRDMHWTAAGHALMAAELERFLRERMKTPPPRPG